MLVDRANVLNDASSQNLEGRSGNCVMLLSCCYVVRVCYWQRARPRRTDCSRWQPHGRQTWRDCFPIFPIFVSLAAIKKSVFFLKCFSEEQVFNYTSIVWPTRAVGPGSNVTRFYLDNSKKSLIILSCIFHLNKTIRFVYFHIEKYMLTMHIYVFNSLY